MSHHWHENVGVRWCPCDEDQEAPGVPTAPVPDPRFRDQLAEVLVGRWLSYGEDHEVDDLVEHPDRDGARITATHAGLLADALLPLIAAEVEAQVQAAANQRAEEAEGAVIRAVQLAQQWEINAQSSRDVAVAAVALVAAGQLRAALASPAPAPRAEEGQ